MKKIKENNKGLIYAIVCLFASMIIIISSLFTMAYFNYKKSFDGIGYLPVLSINFESDSSLKNIYYYGQEKTEFNVSLNTLGNNIDGYVRIKAAIVWSDSLSQTCLSKDDEMVTACTVMLGDESAWTYENGYYYLNSTIKPNTEMIFANGVKFANLTDEYLNKKIDIYVICEIYQQTNLPTNWRV